MAATLTSSPALAPNIRSLLRRLRWRIRAYVWLEGLLLALVWLGLTFWIGLALDYLPVLVGASEMPRAARLVLLVGISGMLAWILYRYIVRRTFVALSNRSLALLLERRFSAFHDSLVTAVELTERPDHAEGYDPDMLERTHQDAIERSREVRLGQVFNYRPLLSKFAAAFLLLCSIAAFYGINREALALGLDRLYLLSDEPWPRWAHIEVVGVGVEQPVSTSGSEVATQFVPFQNRSLKVAKGASLQLQVRAEAGQHVVPDVCTVYYETDQQERGRVQMTKIGQVRDGYQKFAFDGKPLRGILSSMEFDVIGYDHRASDFRIEVVDNPTIVETKLDVVFPEYLVDEENSLWLPRHDVDWAPGTQFPLGSEVTIRARSNKPLQRALVQDLASNNTHEIEMSGQENPQELVLHVPRLEKDLALEIVLHDTDDVMSQRPHRVFIAAIQDEPPRVDVVLQGIREAITPQAIVPVEGKISDDYQLQHAWFEVRVNEDESRKFPLRLTGTGEVQASLDFRDLRGAAEPLAIEPEDKLTFTVQASDKYNLSGDPNVGSGDAYQLNVVTPDQLLVMLESRELSLRQRFEIIITEMEQMRDSLLSLPGTSAGATPVAEPGDEQLDAEALAERERSLRLIRAQQAEMQALKSAQEIEGVAISFDEIRAELINNRVDSEDKQSRLKEQVSDPLKRVAGEMFPELDRRLTKLQELAVDADASGPAAEQAVAQANQILAELEKVLERMFELESYNELIDLVRSLIEEQERAIEATKEERKRQVLDLLQ